MKSEEGVYTPIAVVEVSLFFKSAVGGLICFGVMVIYEEGSLAVFFFCHDGSVQKNRDSICGDL